MSKTALLIVSFGTTYPQTRHETIEATENAFQMAFPDAEVFRAFTSKIVVSRIKQNEDITIDSPQEAIAKISAAGFDTLYVQSLHLIPGIEYHQVEDAVRASASHFKRVVIGRPLLNDFADYQAIVHFLKQIGSPLAADEAVLFMGHGTANSAFTAYACLDHMLMDSQHYMGAVESYPDIQFEIGRLKAAGTKKVRLQPFMLVAGNHAHNDMASDAPDSWQSQLQRAGIQVTPVQKGMGAYPEIQQQFVAHLKRQLAAPSAAETKGGM
ncbi:sirohydrochlorin cobaltochelatase [Secundilactobacillus paracollinoides]|uniref:Sirohydrochlorin cobaltochelatase n=1 Tax=Secundilactobacillus paracollinoides TaxID=240427 RepID=A0A1B2IYH0_9LACO|nr:sirohydrochlorin cobaltochelatase [Secundilactobacillus paracollinoides]ANZ61170.1 sirohydrochlorin cobaltochelatase [Secundilactobacillus paracollinoides]ANZ64436.1 sirohydrochlorin cobaltochelatase [Secundilactobacillus paracollinoides]ANZ67091.1 sirohydrochlorin cobaltochelatase [Secundilactobacillus paracollinoides]KRL76091.1 sirohydrochlorin cobaltochelatase [Secundilactobacillus paracollinoides DSM 15502 = JCM 11969]